jgi:hypothetical protein
LSPPEHDVLVSLSPPTRAELQAAVDAANEEIRVFVAEVPGGRLTGPDRVEYERLLARYNAAVDARDQDAGSRR